MIYGNLGDEVGDTILSERNTASSGYWYTFLYIDGSTKQSHTERFCVYTLIKVPVQVVEGDIALYHKYILLFKLGEKDEPMIPLLTNTYFVYNGKFVTHHQAYNPKGNTGNHKIFNISSYGNDNFLIIYVAHVHVLQSKINNN